MSKKRQAVPYPDEREMEHEIDTILSKGLHPAPSFGHYLLAMYRQVGFRYIFRDATEIVFSLVLAIIVLAAMGIAAQNYTAFPPDNLYTWIFGWSPALYMVVAYFFFMNKDHHPSYEIEMTCKYNVYQLAAFRMLIFSLAAMMINGVILFFIAGEYQLNFYFAFILSTTSLFLFATLFLYIQLKRNSRFSKLVVMAGWGVINMILSFVSSEMYQNILQHIPFYVYGIMTAGGFLLFYKHLKKLTMYTRAKGVV
ncbi:hypothetical protein [Salibacterium halotolerans]|uniref:Uncharacterized protein n=1 Tax=Salibacterium halotolerans TaxID=1884432 RepID=A0A1I5Y842_9BACI|nr:hypothetical protein [Salibacterium halotolerans]SFQ40087.1 hypothetical protein SAMN05518683_1379 [Salibacterium halotolerans]